MTRLGPYVRVKNVQPRENMSRATIIFFLLGIKLFLLPSDQVEKMEDQFRVRILNGVSLGNK